MKRIKVTGRISVGDQQFVSSYLLPVEAHHEVEAAKVLIEHIILTSFIRDNIQYVVEEEEVP